MHAVPATWKTWPALRGIGLHDAPWVKLIQAFKDLSASLPRHGRPRMPPWARHPRSERPAARLRLQMASWLRSSLLGPGQGGLPPARQRRGSRPESAALPRSPASRAEQSRGKQNLQDRPGPRPAAPSASAPPTQTRTRHVKSSSEPSRAVQLCMLNACASAADTSVVGAPVSSRAFQIETDIQLLFNSTDAR